MWFLLGLMNAIMALVGTLYAGLAIAYLDAPYRGTWQGTGIGLLLFGLLSLGPVAAMILAWRTNRRLLAFGWIVTMLVAQIIIENVSGHAP